MRRFRGARCVWDQGRSAAVVADQAHNLGVAGSTPASVPSSFTDANRRRPGFLSGPQEASPVWPAVPAASSFLSSSQPQAASVRVQGSGGAGRSGALRCFVMRLAGAAVSSSQVSGAGVVGGSAGSQCRPALRVKAPVDYLEYATPGGDVGSNPTTPTIQGRSPKGRGCGFKPREMRVRISPSLPVTSTVDRRPSESPKLGVRGSTP